MLLGEVDADFSLYDDIRRMRRTALQTMACAMSVNIVIQIPPIIVFYFGASSGNK
jgi:hypothetical protein